MTTLRLTPPVARPLTVGAARIALINWLFARKSGGRLILRLDDTDIARDADAGVEAVRQDLAWLGLDWDEAIRQSERLALYEEAADRLRAAGLLYPCFESEAELQAKRDQRIRRGKSPVYDRAMLRLTAEQRARAEAGGKRPYWRFKLSDTTHEWHDLVLGRCHVKLPTLSDPVVIRADGTKLHALTSVVDDLATGVTHIVRGEEQVMPTGVQLDIAQALGGVTRHWRFAHLPALVAEPVRRGRGEPTLRDLRQDGVEPQAVCAYLARLGTTTPPAPAPLASLARDFGFAGLSPRAPRFEPAGLLAVNRAVLVGLPFEAVADRLPPAATARFWHTVRGRLDLLAEAREYWEIVAGDIIPPVIPGAAALLRQALAALPPEPWPEDIWTVWTDALRPHVPKGTDLDALLRLALTGEEDGPEMRDLLPLIGRARTAHRLGVG